MDTLKIELIEKSALHSLKEMEAKQLIKIIKEKDIESYALPGEPINVDEFSNWIKNAESTPTVTLSEAKERWEAQKIRLQNITR